MTAFPVPCPHCGERDLAVRTKDLSLYCEGCGEDVSREMLRSVIEATADLLRWLDRASEPAPWPCEIAASLTPEQVRSIGR